MTKELVHRVRAWKPKTKTGCKICRQRRVKCDERRPHCLKCSVAGRECEWYEPNERSSSSSKSQSQSPATSDTTDNGLLLTRGQHMIVDDTPRDVQPHSLAIGLREEERASLGFFLCRTARDLGYSFPSRQWINLSIQLGSQEPALRHAMAALGSMHQARRCFTHISLVPVIDHNRYKQALDSYSKALFHLQRRMTSSKAEDKNIRTTIVLLSCLMFFCFEHLQGETATACLHMQKGQRIVAESQSEHGNGSQIQQHLDKTYNLFAGFQGIDLSVRQRMHQTRQQGSPTFALRMPNYFSSFADANDSLRELERSRLSIRRELLHLASEALSAMKLDSMDAAAALCMRHCLSKVLDLSSHQDIVRNMRSLQASYEAWYAAFLHPEAMLGGDEDSLTILHITFLTGRFTLALSRDSDETMSDAFEGDFTQVLDLAEKCLLVYPTTVSAPSSESAYLSNTGYAIALSTDVLAHISLAGFKSRRSETRKRAMRLLVSANKLEGVYQSAVLAGFIRRPMDREETLARELTAAAPSKGFTEYDIPKQARLSDVVFAQVDYRPRCINMIATRYITDENGEPAVEITEDMFDIFNGDDISRKYISVPLATLYPDDLQPASTSHMAGMPQQIDFTASRSPEHSSRTFRSLTTAVFLPHPADAELPDATASHSTPMHNITNIVLNNGLKREFKNYRSSPYVSFSNGSSPAARPMHVPPLSGYGMPMC